MSSLQSLHVSHFLSLFLCVSFSDPSSVVIIKVTPCVHPSFEIQSVSLGFLEYLHAVFGLVVWVQVPVRV